MFIRIFDEYRKHVSTIIASDLLKTITRYSRIQGSRELWKVVNELKTFAEERGFETRILKIESGSSSGFLDVPVSWDLKEAFLEIQRGNSLIARYSSYEHSTLVAAHSPGGEGCGYITICRDIKSCSGDVVLATGYTYELYKNIDASLILYYSENHYWDAFPYTGLFIKPGEEKPGKTVMTLPYRVASRLISRIRKGDKIRVCWKADTEYHSEGLPVLIACKGEDPGIVYISHICHPKPGAHDNASGSAANAIALDILSKTSKEYTFSSCHIWVPEYTGTVFVYDEMPWNPIGIINFDMVGSKQQITGSTLVIVNPPRFINYKLTPVLWIALQKTMDRSRSFSGVLEPLVKYSVTPYTIGSDHDVFTIWGYESPMVNEWPSKYYHTDMDEVDSIDPTNTAYIGLAGVITGYMISHARRNKLELYSKIYRDYIKSWYYSQAIKTGFSINYLTRYLIKKPLIEEPFEKPPIQSPIYSRKIYRILGSEKYNEIRKINNALTYLEVYAPLAEILDIKDHVKRFKAESLVKWRRREEKIVVDAWERIKNELKI
ncbi:MAG: aminopeptidase [Thermoprotei archaeon]